MRKGKSYHKKHQAIVNDFDNQKSKQIKGDFLKNF